MAIPVRTIAVSVVLVASAFVMGDLPEKVTLARAAGPGGQNDAGSGQDAGDAPPHALLVSSAARKYSGNLSPAGLDIDWYRHAASSAFCSTAESTLSTAGEVTLAADPLRISSASRSAQPQTTVRLALAAPAGQMPYFGIEPAPTLASADGGGAQSPGRYTFKFQSLGLADLDPEGDGEAPEAGATTATAVAVPGPCFAGRLLASGDAADRYYLDVTESREVTLSLAVARGAADTQASLVSPTGVVAATLSDGDAVTVYATELGRWNVVVSRPEATTSSGSVAAAAMLPVAMAATNVTGLETDYLIGLTDGPDPCRPSC